MNADKRGSGLANHSPRRHGDTETQRKANSLTTKSWPRICTDEHGFEEPLPQRAQRYPEEKPKSLTTKDTRLHKGKPSGSWRSGIFGGSLRRPFLRCGTFHGGENACAR